MVEMCEKCSNLDCDNQGVFTDEFEKEYDYINTAELCGDAMKKVKATSKIALGWIAGIDDGVKFFGKPKESAPLWVKSLFENITASEDCDKILIVISLVINSNDIISAEEAATRFDIDYETFYDVVDILVDEALEVKNEL